MELNNLEEIYELILEASRNKEAFKRLQDKLKNLPKEKALALKIAAKSISYITNRAKIGIEEVEEALESVIDERVSDDFDLSLLNFYKWLVKKKRKQGLGTERRQ